MKRKKREECKTSDEVEWAIRARRPTICFDYNNFDDKKIVTVEKRLKEAGYETVGDGGVGRLTIYYSEKARARLSA